MNAEIIINFKTANVRPRLLQEPRCGYRIGFKAAPGCPRPFVAVMRVAPLCAVMLETRLQFDPLYTSSTMRAYSPVSVDSALWNSCLESAKIVTAVGLALCRATRAAPPDNPDPALAPWFESLKQPGTGASCCSIADCRTVEFRQDRDGYEVLIDGRWKMSIPFWLRVPPNRIIDRIDNPTNRAVVCFTPEAGILCFVRPSES